MRCMLKSLKCQRLEATQQSQQLVLFKLFCNHAPRSLLSETYRFEKDFLPNHLFLESMFLLLFSN